MTKIYRKGNDSFTIDVARVDIEHYTPEGEWLGCSHYELCEDGHWIGKYFDGSNRQTNLGQPPQRLVLPESKEEALRRQREWPEKQRKRAEQQRAREAAEFDKKLKQFALNAIGWILAILVAVAIFK